MGCTRLKGFFSFSKIRKTENQHEIGIHNLGHKPPQACLHLPIQTGIKYTFFGLGAFWYCFFKKGVPQLQVMQGLRRVNSVRGTRPA